MALRCAFSAALRPLQPLLSRQQQALRFLRSSAGRTSKSSPGASATATPTATPTANANAATSSGARFQHPMLGGIGAGAALFLLWSVLVPRLRAKPANPLGTWGVDRDDSVLRFGDSRSSQEEPQHPLRRPSGEPGDGWKVVKDGDGVKKMEFDDGRGNKGYFYSRSWGTSVGPDGKVITFGNGASDDSDGFSEVARIMDEHMKQFDQIFRGGLLGGPMFPRLFGGEGSQNPFEGFLRPGVRLTPVPSNGGTGGIRID
eukprot:RCo045766